MPYYNYHATVKRLIAEGKLLEYRFVDRYRNIPGAFAVF